MSSKMALARFITTVQCVRTATVKLRFLTSVLMYLCGLSSSFLQPNCLFKEACSFHFISLIPFLPF